MKTRTLGAALFIFLAAGAAANADVTPHAGMLRWPDVSATQIVFEYANDLWVVPKAGGMASPLASPPGLESLPKFSPDGKTVAFIGDYDGNRDIYTMPVTGGVPFRVTYHPAGEATADWTPDGKILFLTNGLAGLQRQTQLFTVPAAGGLPEKLPVPYAGFGSISPDSNWLAYTTHSTDTRTWKRYRGGMATDIWLFNLKDHTSKKITDWEGTDTLPMWVPQGDGENVYYLSDNGPAHRLNIWVYSTRTGKREQVTTFTDDDIRWPSIGPGDDGKGEIVFQLGAKLMLLNLGTRQSKEVVVTIPGDRPQIRERMVDAAKNVASAGISPTAKRVAIEARGDIWTAPAKEGPARNLTRTDGVAERDPAWSPDGAWIAYFSDETGENELWVRPSDAKPAESKDDKKDGDKADKDAKTDAAKPADGAGAPSADAPTTKPGPRRLSNLGPGYRSNPTWSPDSTKIVFTDQNGRIYLTDVASGDTKEFDKDPWMNSPSISWSPDSKWVTYARTSDNEQGQVIIADVMTGDKHVVTSDMFNAASPTFDRKGDELFFVSRRSFNNPVYSPLDTTFAYTDTDVVLMVPLRNDVKNPEAPKSDEETIKPAKKPEQKNDKKDDSKDDKKDAAKPADAKPAQPEEKKPEEAAPAPDAVTGVWSANATFDAPPQGMPKEVPFTLKLKLEGDKVTGEMSSAIGAGGVSGTFDVGSGALNLSMAMGPQKVSLMGTVTGEAASGSWTHGQLHGTWKASRTSKTYPGGSKSGASDSSSDASEEVKEVKIDFDGFERRAIQLDISPGGFGNLAVADGEKLVFVKRSGAGDDGEGDGGGPASIRVYDYTSDDASDKKVTTGGGFQLSADGKKLLVFRGGSNLAICDASPGAATQQVPTSGMTTLLAPRDEWKEIFSDSWRIMRDYFYEPTMHGVDWAKMREHYGAMVDDAATREDVNWIISEMISELNIGHAYLTSPGDVEQTGSTNVGMLGCDFDLASDDAGHKAYKITRIYEGAPWDSDARGPLSQPGVEVKVGDYILAVNGEPVDTSKAPWAAFVGDAGRITSITVSTKPFIEGSERHVLVKPIGSEATLRYRAWIEHNRAYVDQKTNGQVGYIYVPNTGRDGQSDLFRQFFGQKNKAAIIIDERWNGGGQIPTRFIELLNRPATNYWARRDGHDWTWPPDSAQGAKCMLINGLAGSGGDMFPWLFKHDKIGPVIGMRTWGGLVGIAGNPGFIDGGSISVPNFGFYKTNGTWGIEGHGVDPDIQIIDDPALMWNGGDPQLDKGIEVMLDEIKQHPYTPPKRPASPDKSGMPSVPADW
ncbi:MAG: peptidase S41 [Tepidisphaera sp.]|nr:peptidase S41 [Tepidisphaera sp.]